MNKKNLPIVVTDYIDASNNHDIEAYISAFSEKAIIEEESIGKTLKGKEEIKNYFVNYFVETLTHTEIIDYEMNENFVDMKVLFKGNFAGGEIVGIYQFYLENKKIIKLKADLE
jgi:hypothetical protein